ncbi:nucleotide-binding alpha-beta plait domain-containing protein [Artemisia annua]|uniref:Nucleotide-binding alpha-beta plait domain-containing protein n=1 Tax=Artemisia annua TaxID=35608 RepID=A0A2U1L9Z4_ARTAN|nr:nucleotide-binding alpha-beta plait domain-containing protein [Artemisia annua]
MDRRRKIIPENIQRRITKIFVTNLPERCSGTDLASYVRQYGQIFGLYIARKRDKGGNRFGFVSMLDVKDKDELLKSLRNIRMGDCRLWFSVAQFVLEDGEIKNNYAEKGNHSTKTYRKQHGDEDHREGKATFFKKGERSFKDMLVGKSVRIHSNVTAFSGLYGRALIARMIDLDALKNIKIILNEICPSLGRVQYLGGLDVLITFDDAETALAVRDAARSILGRFLKISIWEGQAFGFERLAWLKVQGIPLHLLSNEVIDAVGGVFGKVEHKANRSDSDRDLSW